MESEAKIAGRNKKDTKQKAKYLSGRAKITSALYKRNSNSKSLSDKKRKHEMETNLNLKKTLLKSGTHLGKKNK